jgi:HAE1 family hydrophobic/amphiphilic exporter-1
MTVSDFSIRRPVFAWMLMSALVIFGSICLMRLGISQLPDITFPVLTVNITWPGAAPQLMESEIVDKVEEAMISLQGIKNIDSVIRQGRAMIKLEFVHNRSIDAALQEANARLRSVEMPSGVEPPTILKINFDDQPFLWLAVLSSRPLPELVKYVDLNLRDKFQIIPGVGDIMLAGWSGRNLRVWVDNEKLRQYELTILDVKRTLEAEHVEVASGYLEGRGQELNVRVMGEGLTPEEVAGLRITQRGEARIFNSNIRVKDVARVTDGLNDIRQISRVNGQDTIGLGIRKQKGYNEVAVGRAVKKRVEELNRELPADIRIQVNYDGSHFTEEAVQETEFTLVLSAIITGLVCWFFLGSLRSTFNVLISIPTSVLGTFIVMYFMDFTLNFFTLLGLSLAIGIVVDDAIMVLENITRHFHMGKTSETAARDGAREITFAAVAATVAVVAIFLPVLLLNGVVGTMLFQFGLTISAAAALSLVEAVTLTPMRCAQFMTAKEDESRLSQWVNHIFYKFAEFYGSVLQRVLNHRWKVVLGSMAIFVLTVAYLVLAGMGKLPGLRFEFSPSQDASVAMMKFKTPVGSSLEFTSARIKQVEDYLMKQPYVRTYFANAGGLEGSEINSGIAFVSLVPPSERKMSQQEILRLFRDEFKKIPDLKTTVIDLTQGDFSPDEALGMKLAMRGPDYAVLKEKCDELVKKCEHTGMIVDLDTDFQSGSLEAQLIPDRAKAAAANVTISEIVNTVNAAMGGVRVGKYTNGERRYDTRMRLELQQCRQVEDLSRLMVRTTYGEMIPITDVTRIQTVPTLLTISRSNRQRSISITGNIAPGASQAVAVQEALRLGKEIVPVGYDISVAGGSQAAAESFQALPFMLILGIVVSYMVLGVQFNSFIHPFTVLISLPFTLVGVVLALVVTHQSFNLYSGIGIILLMGIVKKNSILLVEFFNKQRYERGKTLLEAILSGGPIRLRPIVMTSTATSAAAIPAALGIGPGAEVRIPLAVAVLGGVIVSTGFTLLVVPCVYSLMAGLERHKRKWVAQGALAAGQLTHDVV